MDLQLGGRELRSRIERQIMGSQKYFVCLLNTLTLFCISTKLVGAERDGKTAEDPKVQIQILKTDTGESFGLLGEKPISPKPTILVFGGDLEYLGDPEFRLLADRGFLCVSMDAPSHGSNRESNEPQGLDGWRYRIEDKRNFVEVFCKSISRVLDHLIAEGYTEPKKIAAVGNSRGGFLAFHFAAIDPRVCCVAGLSPVTNLRTLREFSGMDTDPLTRSLAIVNQAEKFGDRKVLVIIGDQDERVGTDDAVAFARQISRLNKKSNVDLHVLHEPRGHVFPEDTYKLTIAWLTRNLETASIPPIQKSGHR
jgi:dienelactone hydrolase